MSQQRLILHIGANKTGSSAVQSFLRLNKSKLKSLGYLVPDKNLELSNQVTGEHVFAFQRLFEECDNAKVEAKIRALLKGADGASLLLSAENLSNNANFNFFGSFLRLFNCKVILYVRRQDDLLTSSWQQWHSKRQSDLDAWLFEAIHKLGHWKRCIEGWEGAVGQGNVIVRVFQKADLVNGDIVDDFMTLLDIKLDKGEFVRESGLVNPSYSDLITSIVSNNSFLFATDHDNDFYKFVQEVTGDYYVKQKKISLISRRQRDNIVTFYNEENQAVAKKYLPGRVELFERVDHSKYEYLDKDELTRRQLGFVTSLMYGMWKKANNPLKTLRSTAHVE